MKIAYIITRMDEYGGAQVHIRDLCTWLQAKGHEPVVLSGWPGKVSDFLTSMDVPFYKIEDLQRPIRPLKDIRAFLQIRAALKQSRPDIVSCHSSKAGIAGRLAARSLGMPVIFTAHGWAFTENVPQPGRSIYKWVEKIGAWFSDHIVTVSEYDRNLALKSRIAKARRITTVHNGMPDRPAPGRERDRVQAKGPVELLMVARIGPQKDHETVIRALADINDLDWHMRFAGGGDDLELRDMARALGLDDRIEFLGERTDIAELMEDSDIYMLISHWEGFPRSILEAMRARLPVIATDVAGVRESVMEGENGYTVGRGDRDDLARALADLIKDPEKRIAMGTRGREMFEQYFTFTIMAEKTMAVYNHVLDRRGPGRRS